MVATPAPTMVTVPLDSTVATPGCKLVKLTGSPELAVALRSKLLEFTSLSAMSTKVIVWSARGVAVTMKGWVAVADCQGA